MFTNKSLLKALYLLALITFATEWSWIRVYEPKGTMEDSGLTTQWLKTTINTHNAYEYPQKRIALLDKIGNYISNIKQELVPRNIFNRISNKIEEIKNRYYLNSYIEDYQETFPERKFGLIPWNSIYKPIPDGSNLPEPTDKLDIHAARNESETFQLIILPFENPLENISIEIKGIPFAYKTVKCFYAGYVWSRPPVYKTDRIGWYADPLLSLQQKKSDSSIFENLKYPITFKSKEQNSIWVTVNIPKEANPGSYPLEIIVKGKYGNKTETESCKIDLIVHKTTIPDEHKLKTAFSFNAELYQYVNKIPDFDKNFNRRKYVYDFFKEYSITPTFLGRYNKIFPPVEDWEWLIERHVSPFCIGYASQQLHLDTLYYKWFDSTIRADIKYLNTYKNGKLKPHAYLFGFDEITPTNFGTLELVRDYIRSIDKEIPFACTSPIVEDIKNDVDWWMPINFTYEPDKDRKIRPKKSQLWWSITMSSVAPYPTLFIEGNAIEPRIEFWQGSKYNIDGFKYYETVLWGSNFIYEKGQAPSTSSPLHDDPEILQKIKEGKRWPEIPWNSYSWTLYNGDGQLFYPGYNAELLPSIRLINLRDGIEDFELLNLLKTSKASDKQAFLERMYQLTPNQKDYLNEPERLLKLRKELLDYLDKL